VRYTYAASRTASPAGRPRRGSANCSSVRKRHLVRQLALRRKVSGDVAVVSGVIHKIRRSVTTRVEHEHLFLEFKADYVDGRNVVGISSHKNKTLGRISKGIAEQSGRKIDIGTFLVKLHDTGHSVSGIFAITAFLNCMRKPYLVSVVIPFNDLNRRLGLQCLKIEILSSNCMFIMRIRSNSGGEELNANNIVIFSQQRFHKHYGVKPLARRDTLQHAVIEVESVYVRYSFLHVYKNCKGLSPFGSSPCPASPEAHGRLATHRGVRWYYTKSSARM